MNRPVIVSRPDRVGDVIISTACLPLVRAIFPGCPILFLAQATMRPLFSGGGVIDEFLEMPHEEVEDSLERLFRGKDAQAIIHFHPDRCVERAARRAGISQRVGFDQGESQDDLTYAMPYRKSDGAMHEAEYCRQLLVQGFSSDCDSVQRYRLSPDLVARDELHRMAPWLDADETRILINPTTARIDLRWPPEYFDKLFLALQGEGRRIVLIGHPNDDPALKFLREAWSGRDAQWSDLAGQLNLAQLAWLLEQSHLHISRDTGTSHLAGAMGCPQVAVMARPEGEFSPRRWKPLGETVEVVATRARRRIYETRRMFWRRSFRSIEPERVIRAARWILS